MYFKGSIKVKVLTEARDEIVRHVEYLQMGA
jgi:hypothetical protein